MSKVKSPTLKIENASVKLLAFYPNLAAGKNQAYAVVANDGALTPNGGAIRVDETGRFLRVSELALKLSDRLALHKGSRQQHDKPLIFDERALDVCFNAPNAFAIRCAMCGRMETSRDSKEALARAALEAGWKRIPLMKDGEVEQKTTVCPSCLATNPTIEMFGLTFARAEAGGQP